MGYLINISSAPALYIPCLIPSAGHTEPCLLGLYPTGRKRNYGEKQHWEENLSAWGEGGARQPWIGGIWTE